MALGGLTKAELTRATIVDAALKMAQENGLEGLTIGTVAERSGLSKSGVFSRMGSREDLQVAALKEYERRFVETVFVPALREPRGLPRLHAICTRWVDFIRAGTGKDGCLFISGSVEYDDHPGPVRDAVLNGLSELRRQLARTIKQAVDEGQLAATAEPDQVAFELYAIILGIHNEMRLFRDPRAWARGQAAMDRVLKSFGAR